jgi:hypothetical protein
VLTNKEMLNKINSLLVGINEGVKVGPMLGSLVGDCEGLQVGVRLGDNDGPVDGLEVDGLVDGV